MGANWLAAIPPSVLSGNQWRERWGLGGERLSHSSSSLPPLFLFFFFFFTLDSSLFEQRCKKKREGDGGGGSEAEAVSQRDTDSDVVTPRHYLIHLPPPPPPFLSQCVPLPLLPPSPPPHRPYTKLSALWTFLTIYVGQGQDRLNRSASSQPLQMR